MKKVTEIKQFFDDTFKEASDLELGDYIRKLERDLEDKDTSSPLNSILELAKLHRQKRIDAMKAKIFESFRSAPEDAYLTLGAEEKETLVSMAADLCFAFGSPEAAQVALRERKTDPEKQNRFPHTLAGAEAII